MKRRKPKSPEQIMIENAERRAAERNAQRQPENWGQNVSALTLEKNEDVEGRKAGKHLFARRSSWVDRVMTKGQPGWHAVNRLSDLIATRKGEGDRPQGGASSPGSRDLVNAAMMEAGRIVDAVLALIGIADRKLLLELIDPHRITANGQIDWRVTVAIMTGEKDRIAQAAIVRSAARNLAAAWVEHDYATSKKTRLIQTTKHFINH